MLIRENESAALLRWLSDRPDVPRLTSVLSRVEVIRACRRFDESIVPTARGLLAGLNLVPLTTDLLERAATIGPPDLRSLDAIHLASGLSVGAELSAFVVYDRRLRDGAENEHLPVVAPA